MAVDRVGNTPKLARIAGFQNNRYRFSDALSNGDRDDLYLIRVNRSSSFNLLLSNLSRNTNANVELYSLKVDRSLMLRRVGNTPFSNITPTALNRNFTLRKRSANPNNQREQFTVNLTPGTYYLRLRWVKGTTPYNLNLRLTPLPPPPSPSPTPFSQAWIKQLGGAGNDYGYGIALDQDNNLLISGVSENAGSSTRSSFIAKYLATNGTQSWLFNPALSGNSTAFDVAADAEGGVYAAGIQRIANQATIAANPFGQYNDAFVAKYDGGNPPGNPATWLKSLTTKVGAAPLLFDAVEAASSVRVYTDTSGETYTYTAGFLNIAPNISSLIPSSPGQAFIAKYDDNGNPVSGFGTNGRVEIGGDESDAVTSMALDSAGNIYVAGITNATLSPNLDIDNPFTDGDAFVAKYSPDGNEIWFETLGGAGQDYARGVAVDSLGNVYITGDTAGALGDNVTQSFGGTDGFVARFTQQPNGTSVTRAWVKQFGTAGTDQFQGIAINRNNQIFLTGETDQGLFGKTPLGGSDAWLAQINANGTITRSTLIGTAQDDEAYRLVANTTGVYLVGQTQGTLAGSSNAGGYDAWVAKYTF